MSSYDLCEELIVEIFSRLPPKSLLRFRSVSKSLRALIGSPGFMRLHSLRSPKRFVIRHSEIRYKEMYDVNSEAQVSSSYAGITPIAYPFDNYDTNYAGSCNGIVCIYDNKMNAFHLWNPSIRRKVTIQYCKGHCRKSFTVLAFFFDPKMHDDDYTILTIGSADTLIYTMNTGTWREIASSSTFRTMAFMNRSRCFLDGALHCLTIRDKWLGYDPETYFIVRFELSSEVFSTIELPQACCDCVHVTIIKDCLAVTSVEQDGNGRIYSRIWVRNTTTTTDATAASWSFAYKVDNYLESTKGDLFFTRDDSRGIVVYNLETKLQTIVVPLSDFRIGDMIIMFTESLRLLDVGTSCDQGEQTIQE